MSKPASPWVTKVVNDMNKTGARLSVADIVRIYGEPTDPGATAQRRIASLCGAGYMYAHKSGSTTVFEATGKVHGPAQMPPSWKMANNMPRVSSVFHLAQGVYA